MRALIINEFGQHLYLRCSFIPRVGDKVDAFYEPLPSVTQVVAFPSEERLKALKIDDHVDAILTVR